MLHIASRHCRMLGDLHVHVSTLQSLPFVTGLLPEELHGVPRYGISGA